MKNPIRTTLEAGEASIGSWLNLASPLAAEVMAAAGYQWLAVDAEHAAFDLELIAHTFRGIEARGAIPLVRVWDHDPVTIARVLDAGAWGIIVPHVSNPEQAEKLAQATRYPPRGKRSVGTGRCVTLAGYREWIDDEVLCIPQIEDMEGIEKAEAIASVEGIDIGFLGPGDLAMSMGLEAGHADHEAALQHFRKGCERAGKPSGLPTRDAAGTKERIAQGFKFIDLNNDLRFLEATANQALADAQS